MSVWQQCPPWPGPRPEEATQGPEMENCLEEEMNWLALQGKVEEVEEVQD